MMFASRDFEVCVVRITVPNFFQFSLYQSAHARARTFNNATLPTVGVVPGPLRNTVSVAMRLEHARRVPDVSDTSATACDFDAFAVQKRAAIIRGLDYVQRAGDALLRNQQLASRHGADVLIPFYVPPTTAAGSPEERHAFRVASHLATEWRARAVRAARYLPPRVPPATLLDLMQGLYSLEGLGMGEPSVRAAVLERSAAWGAVDYFKYDVSAGEPAVDTREECMCGMRPAAGASECPACKRAAVPMSKFDVWLEALVWSFHGCRMRIGLGACFFDVLKQVCGAFAAMYPQR